MTDLNIKVDDYVIFNEKSKCLGTSFKLANYIGHIGKVIIVGSAARVNSTEKTNYVIVLWFKDEKSFIYPIDIFDVITKERFELLKSLQ